MHTVILYIYIVGLALGIALLSDRKIEDTIPVSVFGTILFQFVMGVVFNNLKTAYITTLCGATVLIATALAVSLRRKNLIDVAKKNCITNGLLVFSVMFVWIYLISRGFVVKGFDEYSHWATVVKNMTFFDRFGNYEFSTCNRMFPGYPPGVSMWQYFCCCMYGKYHEGTLFQAYDLMLISCIVPVCSKFNIKKIINGCAAVGILAFISIMFYPELFNSLYVDVMLGFVMAYALYHVYDGYGSSELFFYINLTLVLAVLCLVKASGIFLATITVVTLFVCQCKEDKEIKYKHILKTLASVICYVVLGKLLWSIHLSRTSTRKAWNTSSVTLSGIVELFKGNGKEYQYQTVKNFMKFLYEMKLTGNLVRMNYIETTVFLIILTLIVFLAVKKERRWMYFSISLLCGQIIYTVGMLVLYIFTFSEGEAVALASNERYLNTYFVGFLLFVIMVMLTRQYDKRLIEYGLPLIMAGFVVIVNFRSIYNLTFNYKEYNMGYSYVQDKYGDLAGSSELLDYQKDRIGMVTLEEDPYENIAAFHYMTPVNMGVVYDFGMDRKNYSMSPDEWFDDILAKDMSHIYVMNLDDNFIDTYGECFMNTPQKGMYYIDKENRMLIACE